MALLVVGSVALDTVSTPRGQLAEGLGGSAVYFSIASSLFTPVHLVGVVGKDFPEEHISTLETRGVDVEGLYIAEGKTFRWHGRYDEDFGDPETISTELNVFADFSPKLPPKYRDLPFVFLGNIHPKLQLKVLEQMKSPKLVAADTMNFWIERERNTLLQVLEQIDMLIINELEVRLLTGVRSVLAGAEKIHTMGPATIVVKQGAYGAFAMSDGEIFTIPAFPTTAVMDPTGAGDSFAGGMVGYIARQGNITPHTLKMGIVYGSLVASFNVEGFSIKSLEKLDMETLNRRLEKFRKMTEF
ncbi:sugar kinase [bacterium]|nr:MAG: sugar kinase [bacterium]